MTRLAVLLYVDASNPDGLPDEWPAEVRYVEDPAEPIVYPWIEMTQSQYEAYRLERQPLYDAWEYARDLKAMKLDRIEVIWNSALAYNSRFFTGGAFSQILELKLAGLSRALETQIWMLTLWNDYFARRYAIESALLHEEVQAVSDDFSNHGNPPWTVSEMLAQVQF